MCGCAPRSLHLKGGLLSNTLWIVYNNQPLATMPRTRFDSVFAGAGVSKCDGEGLQCWHGVEGGRHQHGEGEENCDCKQDFTRILSHHCKCDDVRNNCEMTHFFFSLIREPLQEQKLMPLVFYFDTHIITQVTLNVRHTFFDKVRLQTCLSTLHFNICQGVCHRRHIRFVLWSICDLPAGAALLSGRLPLEGHHQEEEDGVIGEFDA